jgi:hypothetical protein
MQDICGVYLPLRAKTARALAAISRQAVVSRALLCEDAVNVSEQLFFQSENNAIK